MTRKIIQIAACGDPPNSYPLLVALCNDGSVWAARYNYDSPNALFRFRWSELPKIGEDER